MAIPAEYRVRPPKDKEDLIQQLGVEQDGPFATRYQVLTFAAALGWSRGRRGPFTASGEPIRYDLFRRHTTIEAFIDALAVLTASNDESGGTTVDASIMSDERLQERIAIFEEYANGGLAIIQGELNTTRSRPMDVLLDLCRPDNSTANDYESLDFIFDVPTDL